jgi:hypothetical protein
MATSRGNPPSYRVDTAARTVAEHNNGLSPKECRRIDGSIAFIEKISRKDRKGSIHWVSVSKPTKGKTFRTLADDIWKRIRRLQRDADSPPYIVLVFETAGPHLVYLGNDELEQRLQRHRFDGNVQFDPVNDSLRLRRAYLVKERTTQANYQRQQFFKGGRIKGSHKLPGGGDRVRLTGELERDAVAAGYIEPWRKTYAQRMPRTARKDYRSRPILKRACKASGQIALLPELERPVSRLRAWGGGFMPPAVAEECEFLRRRFGLAQHQLAALIGVTQPTYANAIAGRFGLSPFAARRLRDVLLTRNSRPALP